MNRFVQLALVILSLLPLSVMAANDKPFTIPELKDWQGGEGFFTPSTACRIVYRGKQPELRRVAQQLADDYALLTGRRLEVATGKPANGDIVLEIAADKKLGNEGYAIRIADGVRVKSPGAKGLYWATRTLLQLSEQHQGSMPKGSLRDWPDYPMRGFMLDCGRKFFPMSMLRDYVKILSYYKMNTFHIHLSDNGFKQFFGDDWNKTYAAFRMECGTYPGLTARDGYYTKAEFRDLYRLADSLGVTIIPEIDVPAHSLAFTHYRPSIASKDYGNDHLDLFNPETYHFLDSLFAEYLQGPDPSLPVSMCISVPTNIPIKTRKWSRNSATSPTATSAISSSLARRPWYGAVRPMPKATRPSRWTTCSWTSGTTAMPTRTI